MDALERISQPFPPSVHTQYQNAQSLPLTGTWQQHSSIFSMSLYIIATHTHHNTTGCKEQIVFIVNLLSRGSHSHGPVEQFS